MLREPVQTQPEFYTGATTESTVARSAEPATRRSEKEEETFRRTVYASAVRRFAILWRARASKFRCGIHREK